MGRYIPTALFKNGHDSGYTLLELGGIYLVELRHHHIGRISLYHALEDFVLHNDFA